MLILEIFKINYTLFYQHHIAQQCSPMIEFITFDDIVTYSSISIIIFENITMREPCYQ